MTPSAPHTGWYTVPQMQGSGLHTNWGHGALLHAMLSFLHVSSTAHAFTWAQSTGTHVLETASNSSVSSIQQMGELHGAPLSPSRHSVHSIGHKIRMVSPDTGWSHVLRAKPSQNNAVSVLPLHICGTTVTMRVVSKVVVVDLVVVVAVVVGMVVIMRVAVRGE
jgi:hypothetical protein